MPGQGILLDTPPSKPQSDVECRVWERHPCELRTSCQPIAARADKDFLWPATVRDISVNGIGLVLARRFEPGVGLVIEVPGTAEIDSESLLARVVHATSLTRGLWLHGCIFPSPLSDDELCSLLQRATSQREQQRTSAAVNRPTPRPCPERPALAQAVEPARDFLVPCVMFETTAAGMVLRMLVRAVRLTGAWPLAEGAVLTMALGSRGVTAIPTKLVVKRCTLQDEQWTVHFSFAEKPSLDVLRLFGHP